jgi:hydroxymethylpyrimidine pyrophosphatase-like HAD family hydrolase
MPLNGAVSALACDYDGTLATEGQVNRATLAALTAFRAGGHKLVLITGREVSDLQGVCPDVSMFDLIVAENGAVLFSPADSSCEILAPPPDPMFIAALRQRNINPLAVGEVVVATTRPHLPQLNDAIHESALDLHIVMNREAAMVLPRGVDKASGLKSALRKLRLTADRVVGVGDAENDEAFLRMCGFAVAVSNALPSIKQCSDYVTAAPNGAGVVELLARYIPSLSHQENGARP